MIERKILLVDDEAQIRELLEMALNKVGYTVRSAAGAEEAFNIIAREKIAVMFIDLRLETMNGFELCKNIRKDNPEAIIYAFSGYTGYYDPQQFLEAGFDGILDKPIILKDLYQVVKESFEKLGSQRNPSL